MSEHDARRGNEDDLDTREIYKSKFLVGEDLDGQEYVCKIAKTGLQTVPSDDGEQDRKIKALLQPAGKVPPDVAKAFRKPLLFGKREADKVGRMMGTPKAKYWVGGIIVIYPMRGRFYGQDQVVPRVRDRGFTRPPTQGPAEQPDERRIAHRAPDPDDDGRDMPNPAG
jgi:hypothetical protein